MNWLQQVVSRRREYRNLSDEMTEHLQEKVEELISGGMPPQEADAAARREFGNALLLEEHSREVWQWATFDSILRDLRYAFRQLRRNPGFTLTVLLTLSVAIGANTTAFSLVNALLFRPLPYTHPERLASLMTHQEGFTGSGKALSDDEDSVDGETWELVRDNVPAVIAGAWSSSKGVNLQVGSIARYVQEQRVSARYFDALGIPPFMGRNFADDEDRPGGPQAVLLSYELWGSLFSADSEILGKFISLKGAPYRVIGILPPHTTTTSPADLWTPLRPSRFGEGAGDNYGVVMRLRDDATWAEANSQLARLRPALLENFKKRHPQGHAWLFALPLQQDFAREQSTPALILMTAVAFILLIASANLTGLMLVRVTRRAGEISTRLALGATRGSIFRQLMMEPFLLALAGGLMGIALAMGGLSFLTKLLPSNLIPIGGVSLDGRVLGFAMAISCGTGLLIGVLPALDLRRFNIRSFMATSHSRSGNQNFRRRTRQMLIAGEITLTVVLLTGAGLLIRTLNYLQTLPPGFDATNVLTAKVSLDDARYHDAASFHKLLQQSIAAIKRIPGVESAAVALSLPYERGFNNGFTVVDGDGAGKHDASSSAYVTPDFFHTLRIPLLAGRTFSEGDTPESEPVAIVNVSFARKFLGNTNVVGRHIRSGKTNYLIVGEVGDVTKRPAFVSAPLSTEVTYYIPATQMNQETVNLVHVWYQPSWILRSGGPISGLAEAMQKAMAEADPALPFAGFYSLRDLQAEALEAQRFQVLLLGVLASLALLLSLIGVYGLVSNLVVQRTREIGIRMALGSSVSQAMLEVGTSGMAAVALGLAGGLALAAVAVRIIKSELYGVKTYDPLTFVTALALLIIAASAASFLPTRRIASIDPASTLRAE